jgi:hypothetical protein
LESCPGHFRKFQKTLLSKDCSVFHFWRTMIFFKTAFCNYSVQTRLQPRLVYHGRLQPEKINHHKINFHCVNINRHKTGKSLLKWSGLGWSLSRTGLEPKPNGAGA